MEQVIQFVLAAVLSWCPPATYFVPYGETVDQARERVKAIVEDIVTVSFDAHEPPAFGGADGRLKTALLHASIASLENSFQKFVDDGACNKAGYHADRRGNCDGGHAWSLWSLHVFGGGWILQSDGSLSTKEGSPALAAAHPDLVIDGQKLIADRKTAIRVAQRLYRQTLRQYHSLCGYSGESCFEGRHPKAELRLERAKNYLALHPFSETIPEPISVPDVMIAFTMNQGLTN